MYAFCMLIPLGVCPLQPSGEYGSKAPYLSYHDTACYSFLTPVVSFFSHIDNNDYSHA